ETIAMRMCGHAHHDDMLYLGRDPQSAWEYPPLVEGGYADRELHAYWAARDPIALYAARLTERGLLRDGDFERCKAEVEALVEREARAVIDAPWPEPESAGVGVFADEPPRRHVEVLDPEVRLKADTPTEDAADVVSAFRRTLSVEPAPPFDAKGKTF